ncbi:MAG: HEPN domain-containing protein [Spirochaetaceae bacterium]|nr:HEPN domain-containing protein [Spirochaetaceae bacterium]
MELAQWFSIADDDLKSAEYLATMQHPRPEGIICFHCQQSAEKYLKGYLFKNNMEPPKIHDLLKLLELCENVNSQFSTILQKCNNLNRYSVIPRYPDELEITPEDTKNAIQYARAIRVFVAGIRAAVPPGRAPPC